LSPKGKNVDMCYFYAFLMLEEKDFKFASRQLEDGAGASAGFGTVGGGAMATKEKATSGCCSDRYTTTDSKIK
jgi:DNA topoisomerase IB